MVEAFVWKYYIAKQEVREGWELEPTIPSEGIPPVI
jgi:hypothetical protein